MAETGFPGAYASTTVTSETRVSPEVRFDPSYIRTVPGMLKIACLVNIISSIEHSSIH